MAQQAAKASYKWSPEETRQLIRFRAEHEKEFLKSKYAAKQLWEKLLKEMGLEGAVTGQQASKKWENLKQHYKLRRTPKTGSGTDRGETTAATWQFFEDMHEVLGARLSTHNNPLSNEMVEPSHSSTATTSGTSTSPASTSGASNAAGSSMATASPQTPSPAKKKRKTHPIVSFLMEESQKEQKHHEESEAKTDRFLNLFEKMIDKL